MEGYEKHTGLLDSYGNPIPEDAVFIRHTEIPEFRQCRRRWFIFSHNGLNLEPMRKNEKLRFGKCWHTALESYYSTLQRLREESPSEPSCDPFSLPSDTPTEKSDTPEEYSSDVIETLKRQMIKVIGEEFNNEIEELGDEKFDPDVSKSIEEQKELGKALGEAYPQWAMGDSLAPSDKELSIEGIETRIIIPVDTSKRARRYLTAKLDTIVKYMGKLFIMEHKSRAKSSYFPTGSTLQLDLQMTIQLYILREFLKFANPKKISWLAAMGDTSGMLGGAIYNTARKQRPGPRVKSPIFERSMVIRSNRELDNAAETLFNVDIPNIYAFRTEGLLSARLYPNPQPFGECGWKCAAKDVCEAIGRGEDYEYLLEVGFEERKSFRETLRKEIHS